METWAAIGLRISPSILQRKTCINIYQNVFCQVAVHPLDTLQRLLELFGLNVISCNHFSYFLIGSTPQLKDTSPIVDEWLLRALLSSGLFHGFPISSKRFLPA